MEKEDKKNKKERETSGKPSDRRGGRPEKVEKEYDQKMIEVTRVTRVTEGGKRMKFRACIVIGNRAGKVGVGVAKSNDVSISVDKAYAQAKKNMIDVSFGSYTIPCEITAKYKASVVLLKPATEGTNIVSGGAVRSVLELAGVKNVVSKVLSGSKNKITNTYATINALKKLKVYEELKASKFKAKENK